MTPLDVADALELARDGGDLDDLCARARAVRDGAWGSVVTYSPKVFIPLTTLCRDVCHYCTFARPPRRGERAFLTIDEVLAIARAGAAAGLPRGALHARRQARAAVPRGARGAGRAGARDHRVVPGRGRPRRARGDRPAAAREPRASSTTTSWPRCGRRRRRRGSCWRRPRPRLSERGHAALRLARQAARRPARRDRPRRPAADPVHERDPDRHRRDAHRAGRGAARAARPAPAARAPAGGDRPELPRQAGHEDGAGARAVARRPPVDDRRRAPDPAAPRCRCRRRRTWPTTSFPRLLEAGHQRLGRRLARDARPRQPRGAVARARAARRRHRRRRPDAAAAARRLPAVPARRRPPGSIRNACRR